MTDIFTAVDLSQLPPPNVVEPLDFEQVFAEMLADLQARDPAFTALVESDPAVKILQVAAYREVILRQRVNDAAHAVMLAYSGSTDLDNLGALFGVKRLVIDPGDDTVSPPVPPTLESDTEFRRRVQLSLEGFSTAGPRGAYIYHALSADPKVLDANATSPRPGDVLVSVLSRDGDGTADAAVLAAVGAAVSAEDVRPLTDFVTVNSATILTYTIQATLFFFDGPDRALVLERAEAAAQKYADDQHRIGRDITLSGVFAALHQPGVQRVELAQPTQTLIVSATQAAFCTGITLTDGGVAND